MKYNFVTHKLIMVGILYKYIMTETLILFITLNCQNNDQYQHFRAGHDTGFGLADVIVKGLDNLFCRRC